MNLKIVSTISALLVVGSLVAWRWSGHAQSQSAVPQADRSLRSKYARPQSAFADVPQAERPLRVPTEEKLRTVFLQGAKQILQQSQQLVLLSVKPINDFGRKERPLLFHDHGVLGQTVIKDPAQKAALLASFYDGFVPPQIKGLKQISFGCFMPRHGLRATKDGHVVDLLVCFSCRQFDVYLDGQQINHTFISDAPRPTFNQILIQNHIPVSP